MAKRTTSTYDLKPVDEVYRIIKDVTEQLPLQVEQMDLMSASALGYVLAEDVRAADSLPPFPASIKVRSASQ